MVQEITNKNFKSFIENEELTIVKVGAEWCGPCKMVKPILEKESEEGDILIGSIDADSSSELAKELGVRSIPTTFFYKNGEQVGSHTGAFGSPQLKQMIEKFNK